MKVYPIIRQTHTFKEKESLEPEMAMQPIERYIYIWWIRNWIIDVYKWKRSYIINEICIKCKPTMSGLQCPQRGLYQPWDEKCHCLALPEEYQPWSKWDMYIPKITKTCLPLMKISDNQAINNATINLATRESKGES